MNFHRSLAPLALLLGIASSASAGLVANLQAPLTVDLKLTRDTEEKKKPIEGGTETSTSFATIRLTNRDLLQKLIDDGKIIGPVGGWSLVVRCTTNQAHTLTRSVFAMKSGLPEYALDGAETKILDFEQPYAASSVRLRVLSSKIVSGTENGKFYASGKFISPLAPIEISGVGDLALAYKSFALGSNSASLPIPSKVTTALTGGLVVAGVGGEEVYIVEGSINFGAHKVTSLIPIAE